MIKGDIFGELIFFGDRPSDFTAITANVTSLAVLEKASLMKVMQKFPKDYE